MRFLFTVGVLLAAACAPAPREFPVGMFGVNTPEDMRVVAANGFDAIQSYETEPAKVAELAAAAREQGELLLVSPDRVQASTYTAAQFPGVVWYLRDEPDVAGMSREDMARLERQTRAWSPKGETAFVVGDGHKAKDYPGVADDIMVDWYPVPHLPLESAGDHVAMTAAAAGGRKVWAVLQAMDWRDFEQRDPRKPRIGRFPTEAEIRFMSYDAVLNGANGVWYFTYSTSTAHYLSPERMLAVMATAGELRAMAPVFARGRPIAVPFEIDPDGVQARAWTWQGRDYVLLVNRLAGKDARVPDVMLAPTWRPLFAKRRDPRESLREAGGAYYLPQRGVMVLESRLRLRRLFGR
jgi:hypothetical protein